MHFYTEKEVNMQIIDRLFKFFRENNLSNYKVEQACGLSNGYLRNLRKAPSAEILERYSLPTQHLIVSG